MKNGNYIIEIFDNLVNRVDNDLFMYLKINLNDEMSFLEKALAIYLYLGDVLCYSPLFNLTANYDNTSLTRDVNFNNNEIMCKSWSFLYHRILTKMGISSKVVKSRFHYKVYIFIDDVIYQADATAYGNYGLCYSMSDIARIKCGFRIEKFTIYKKSSNNNGHTVDEEKKLSDTIDKVYGLQKRKVYPSKRINSIVSRVMGLVEKNRTNVGSGTEEDILYRIKLINRFWRLDLTNAYVEKMQLFNSYFGVVFGDLDEYEVGCFNMYANTSNGYAIYKLIVLDINDTFYYFLDNGKEFEYCDSSKLVEKIRNEELMSASGVDIPGLYSIANLYK